MTKSQWLNCDDPAPMLEFIRGSMSDRKIRLFACACCRRIWSQFTDQRLNRAVEAAGQFAEGLIDASELFAAHVAAGEIAESLEVREDAWAHVGGRFAAAMAVERASSRFPIGMSRAEYEASLLPPSRFGPGEDTVHWYAARAASHPETVRNERKAQAQLVDEVFGSPFASKDFDPSWLTSTVLTLARGIYADRAFDRLPILADALQDADCSNDDLLSHLRGPGHHWLGCWALDLVLAKQ